MNDFNRTIMLYDFYGDFLTPRQREIFELYYLNDFSLGEIAQIVDITRQGVHDTVKRSTEVLEAYEKQLGMMISHCRIKHKIDTMTDDLKKIEHFLPNEGKTILMKIYDDLNLLLKEDGE